MIGRTQRDERRWKKYTTPTHMLRAHQTAAHHADRALAHTAASETLSTVAFAASASALVSERLCRWLYNTSTITTQLNSEPRRHKSFFSVDNSIELPTVNDDDCCCCRGCRGCCWLVGRLTYAGGPALQRGCVVLSRAIDLIRFSSMYSFCLPDGDVSWRRARAMVWMIIFCVRRIELHRPPHTQLAVCTLYVDTYI